MKNLKLVMMSFVVLTFFSCSEENNSQNELELAKTKNEISTNTSTQKLVVQNCPVEQIINSNNLYNCFGLAFYLSETGTPAIINDQNLINTNFIETGLFKEDNSSNATKVLYWNDSLAYNTKNFVAVDHAAIIIDGGTTVYSKEGMNQLTKNCIEYYYLWKNNPAKTPYNNFYRKYSLNIDLNKPATAPKRGNVFTVSLQKDASSLGVEYTWEYDTSNLDVISQTTTSITLRVRDLASPKSYSVTIKAKHQKGVIVNNISFPKTLTNSYTFTLLPIASFTGSTYVTKATMGSWTSTVSDYTAPYTYSWWIKRQQDPDSFYLQIGTGPQLYLLTRTSIKSTYYNLYLRIIDANGRIFSTEPQIIQSTGVLEEAL